MTHIDAATKYCLDVLNPVDNDSVPACKWVNAACQRQIDDLLRFSRADSPYYFDGAEAERVCNFVSLLPHVKGEWAARGERLKLEPWQQFILTTVFGWKRMDGSRRFRRVHIEMARANAKSTLSAGVALYLLAADGEMGAEVYSAATTHDQASIVFDTARKMAEREPGFRKQFGVEVQKYVLYVQSSMSNFRALSADYKTLDGKRVHGAIIDELHAHPTREVWDVFESATGARRQPLIWGITTAGSNRSGICYEIRTYLTRILNSTLKAHDGLGYEVKGDAIEDESQFGIIYTLDDEDDWTDEAVWIKANPNLNVSVSLEDLRPKALKAAQVASAQPNFLTKHMNVWVNADSAWMDMRAWDRQAEHILSLDDFVGQPCWIGIDLASKIDVASMAILFREEDRYHLFTRHWLPEDQIERSSNSQYEGWARSGKVIVTDGTIIDFERIEEELRELRSRFEVRMIGYDPHQATEFSTRMAKEGFPMTEYPPHVLKFSEPMKNLEAHVIGGKLSHDNNPMMNWMVSNVVCHRDAKDNIFPRKERNENKIDGVVAAIMALGLSAQQTEEEVEVGVIAL